MTIWENVGKEMKVLLENDMKTHFEGLTGRSQNANNNNGNNLLILGANGATTILKNLVSFAAGRLAGSLNEKLYREITKMNSFESLHEGLQAISSDIRRKGSVHDELWKELRANLQKRFKAGHAVFDRQREGLWLLGEFLANDAKKEEEAEFLARKSEISQDKFDFLSAKRMRAQNRYAQEDKRYEEEAILAKTTYDDKMALIAAKRDKAEKNLEAAKTKFETELEKLNEQLKNLGGVEDAGNRESPMAGD